MRWGLTSEVSSGGPPRRPSGQIPAKHVLPAHSVHVGHNILIAIIQLLACDVAVAGVIGRRDQTQISVELPHQRRHVARARRDVLFCIEGIKRAVAFCCRRHELHQPHRSLVGNRPRIPSRLHVDQRGNQLGRYTIAGSVLSYKTRSRSRIGLPNRRARKHEQEYKQTPDHDAAPPRAAKVCANLTPSSRRLLNPSRSKRWRRSFSVLAKKGSSTSRCSSVTWSVPSNSRALAKSIISETDGGFSSE